MKKAPTRTALERALRRVWKLKKRTPATRLPFASEPGPGPQLTIWRTSVDDQNSVVAYAKAHATTPRIQRAIQHVPYQVTALVEVLSFMATLTLPRAIHLATWFMRPEGPSFKGYAWGILYREENLFYRQHGYSMHEHERSTYVRAVA